MLAWGITSRSGAPQIAICKAVLSSRIKPTSAALRKSPLSHCLLPNFVRTVGAVL